MSVESSKNSFSASSEGRPTNYYLDSFDSTSDSESLEWEQREDARILEETTLLVDELREVTASEHTNQELFTSLLAFDDKRRALQLDSLAVPGGSMEPTRLAFDALHDVEQHTDSVYVQRLLAWLKRKEVHELELWRELEYSFDPEAHVHGIDSVGQAMHKGGGSGVKVELSAEAEAFLDEHPEYRALYEYNLEQVCADPNFGDSDFYAPSPYATLATWSQMDEDDKKRLQAEPEVTEYMIETAQLFDVMPDELSAEARTQLFRVGVELDQSRYDRIKQAARRFSGDGDEVLRQRFAEAFLATEFGDDFGDTLLSLAEHCDKHVLGETLGHIEQIRGEARVFSEQFTDFDPELAGEVQRAIGERVTEMLYVLEEMSTNPDGIAKSRVFSERLKKNSPDQVLEALRMVSQGLESINQALVSGDVQNIYASNSTAWQLGSHKHVLLQLKGYGSERGAFDRGIEYSEEAQVNYSVDVSDEPHAVPVDIANYRRRYALSFRIDLEAIIRNAKGDRVGFDATRDMLNAAFDIGSFKASEDNPNYIVGSTSARQ